MTLVEFQGVDNNIIRVNPEYVVSLKEDNSRHYNGDVRSYGTVVQLVQGSFKIPMPIDDVLDMLSGEAA